MDENVYEKMQKLELELNEKLNLLEKIKEVKPKIYEILKDEIITKPQLQYKTYCYIRREHGVKIPISSSLDLFYSDSLSSDFYKSGEDGIHIIDILMDDYPIISEKIRKIKAEIGEQIWHLEIKFKTKRLLQDFLLQEYRKAL